MHSTALLRRTLLLLAAALALFSLPQADASAQRRRTRPASPPPTHAPRQPAGALEPNVAPAPRSVLGFTPG